MTTYFGASSVPRGNPTWGGKLMVWETTCRSHIIRSW